MSILYDLEDCGKKFYSEIIIDMINLFILDIINLDKFNSLIIDFDKLLMIKLKSSK